MKVMKLKALMKDFNLGALLNYAECRNLSEKSQNASSIFLQIQVQKDLDPLHHLMKLWQLKKVIENHATV